MKAHHGSIARRRLSIEDALKRGSCGRWSPRARSSSASTWARWISSCRWSRRVRWHRPPAHRPRRPPRRHAEPGPHLPEVPRGSPRGCCGGPPDGSRAGRGDALPAQPARRPGPAGGRRVRARRVGRRRGRRRWSAAPRRSPTSPTTRSTPSSTSSRAATHPTSSRASSPASCGTAPPDGCGRATGQAGSRSPTAAPSPTVASSASSSPTGCGSAGELDEEMVYESRRATRSPSERPPGASRRSRTRGSSSPPHPESRPACRSGTATSRDVPPARPRGRRRRCATSSTAIPTTRRAGWRGRTTSTRRAAQNLLTYLDDQRTATGVVPDDRTVVVERFPDEIGDWRICILTPFGARVHAPWAMAIEERLAERLDLEVDILWSDDGIALRLPEAIEDLPLDELLVDPDDVEDLVVRRLPATALVRTGPLPGGVGPSTPPAPAPPGERTPLWQQRKKAADLLQVAGRYPDFPMLLETTRERLRDVFDLPALREVLQGLRDRTIRAVSVDTPKASPFAQSLLFGWIATYMYEGDAPLAERRAVALALDRDLLRELLGSDELRELIDAEALAALELELQWLAPGGRRVRSADDLHDLLRDVGDLRDDEIAARASRLTPTPSSGNSWANTGRSGSGSPGRPGWPRPRTQRGSAMRLAPPRRRRLPAPSWSRWPTRWPISSPGTPEPTAVPSGRGRDPPRPRRRTGAPRPRPTRGIRSGRGRRVPTPTGSSGSGATPRCCAGSDVARSPRAPQGGRTGRPRGLRPLPRATWQGVGEGRRGPDALLEVIGTSRGVRPGIGARIRRARRPRLRLPAVRPRRAADGRRGRVDRGRRHRCPRRPGHPLLPRRRAMVRAPTPADPDGPVADALRARTSARRAPRSGPTLVRGRGPPTSGPCSPRCGISCGRARSTNDGLAPLRAMAGAKPRAAPPRAGPGPVASTRLGPPTGAGRWSPMVAALRRPEPSPTELAAARATQLLTRHGVVTREAVKAEGLPGGFAAVYPALRCSRTAGRARRGYFVAGLGAAQFALPGAAERLRAGRTDAADGRPASSSSRPPTPPSPTEQRWRGRRCPRSPTVQGAGRLPRPGTAGAVVVLRGGTPDASSTPRPPRARVRRRRPRLGDGAPRARARRTAPSPRDPAGQRPPGTLDPVRTRARRGRLVPTPPRGGVPGLRLPNTRCPIPECRWQWYPDRTVADP